MRDRIKELNRKARRYLDYAEAARAKREIESDARQPRRRAPITSSGILFTEEGAETKPLASEEVDVPASVPSQDLSMTLRPARYRIRLQVDGAASVDVRSGGELVVSGRQALGHAVLEVEGGDLDIYSSSAITAIRVHRFESRAEGSLILGPFSAEGLVSASVVGDGSWGAEVASDRVYEADLDTDTSPSLTVGSGTWEGTVPGKETPPSRQDPIDGWPWSIVRRFKSVEDPTWVSSVRAGVTTSGHEEITENGVIDLDHGSFRYWTGVGQWAVFAGSEAPAFSPTSGRWTYVWGSAAGIDRAYSMRTGRQTDPSTEGVYLVRGRPDETEIDGAHARRGKPLPKTRRTLSPGPRWKAEKNRHPENVLVRIEGSGTARALELKTKKNEGPKGMETTDTRRIDLSRLWRPEQKNVSSPQSPEGRGVFLPHGGTETSSQE